VVPTCDYLTYRERGLSYQLGVSKAKYMIGNSSCLNAILRLAKSASILGENIIVIGDSVESHGGIVEESASGPEERRLSRAVELVIFARPARSHHFPRGHPDCRSSDDTSRESCSECVSLRGCVTVLTIQSNALHVEFYHPSIPLFYGVY